jgi:hypothetical protein
VRSVALPVGLGGSVAGVLDERKQRTSGVQELDTTRGIGAFAQHIKQMLYVVLAGYNITDSQNLSATVHLLSINKDTTNIIIKSSVCKEWV